MQDLKFIKTETGGEIWFNPFCIGAWYKAGEGKTAIQSNGVVYIVDGDLASVNRAIREALAPE